MDAPERREAEKRDFGTSQVADQRSRAVQAEVEQPEAPRVVLGLPGAAQAEVRQPKTLPQTVAERPGAV